MGKTFSTGLLTNGIWQDSSNNIGIGAAANASFKFQVTGATNLTGALTASTATFESSGSGNTFLINHTSGSGIALTITKGGNGEGLIINKTSGTGNALSVTGTTSLGGALSGTSATFSGSLTSVGLLLNTGGYLGSRSLRAASDLLILYGGTAGFNFTDSTNSVVLASIANSGAATFSSSVTAGNGTFVGDTETLRLYTPINTGYTSLKIMNDLVSTSRMFEIRYYGSGSSVGESAWLGTIGGAPISFSTTNTERLRITAAGNVGIGTNNPGEQLTLSRSTYPTVKLIETTDTAQGYFQYHSDANEFRLVAQSNHPLIFSTNDTERMRINANGNMRLYITPSVDTNIEWYQTPANIIQGRIWTDGNPRVNVQCGGSQGVYLASGGVAWIANSDERFKTDLVPIEDAINKVNSLRSVIGRYKTDEVGTKRTFLIAQDLIKVLPEVVTTDEKTGDLGVSYSEVIPLLVAAIKELKAEIEELKNK